MKLVGVMLEKFQILESIIQGSKTSQRLRSNPTEHLFLRTHPNFVRTHVFETIMTVLRTHAFEPILTSFRNHAVRRASKRWPNDKFEPIQKPLTWHRSRSKRSTSNRYEVVDFETIAYGFESIDSKGSLESPNRCELRIPTRTFQGSIRNPIKRRHRDRVELEPTHRFESLPNQIWFCQSRSYAIDKKKRVWNNFAVWIRG